MILSSKTLLCLLAAGVCTSSFAFQYNIRVARQGDVCVLSINGKAYQQLPKNVALSWIHESGWQTYVLGKDCLAITSPTKVLSPLKAPSSPIKRQKAVGAISKDFMRLWIGPNLKTPNGFKQFSATIIAPKAPSFPFLPYGIAAQWIGLQPTDKAIAKYFVLQPVLGWSEQGILPTNSLYNMYCAPDGCPRGPLSQVKATAKVDMLVKHFAKNSRFPALWQASWKNTQTGQVQKLVIPDNTLNKTLGSPGYCREDYCRLRLGLLVQEYAVSDPVPMRYLFRLFFPVKQIEFLRVRYRTEGNLPVKWQQFVDSVRYDFRGQRIGNIEQLRKFVELLEKDPKRQADYRYNNCMYHLLKQIRYKRVRHGTFYDVVITQPQKNPAQCFAKYYLTKSDSETT